MTFLGKMIGFVREVEYDEDSLVFEIQLIQVALCYLATDLARRVISSNLDQ